VASGSVHLMGDFTTTYPTSDPDRDFNLALAAKKLCGARVEPGAVFSFNGRVGEASVQEGFRPAHVFIGDRIVQGDGGGVCQVVGTLFGAVVRSGLPIVERHLHGLTVPYVPVGEDATIAYGALDFQFRNDTPGTLRLLASARGPSVRVAIYGSVGGVEARFHHRTAGWVEPDTIRVPTRRLAAGQTRVVRQGQKGVTVTTWLTQVGRGGTSTTSLGTHTYRASPRVVEIGVRTDGKARPRLEIPRRGPSVRSREGRRAGRSS